MPCTDPNSRDLTDLTSLKLRLGISPDDSSNDDLLKEIITQASNMFEEATGRRFKSAEYIERFDGYNEQYITLTNYPVIKLNQFRYGESSALSIRYTGSDIFARITTYHDEDGVDGGISILSVSEAGITTEEDIPFSEHPTFALLADEINTFVGWTATASSTGLCDWIIPQSGKDCKSQSVTLYYPGTSDADIKVSSKSGILSFGTCSRYGYEDGDGSPQGYQNIMVHYLGGYDTVPGNVQRLVNEIAALAYASTTVNPAVSSETLGDWSYTLAAESGVASAFNAMKNEINFYKDLHVTKLGK